jgi:HSP20 family molecular chaperone IbpA
MTFNLLESLINMDSSHPNKIMKETNETFDYEVALPGLTREDLDIKAIFEKDFLTVFVNVKKESTFVSEQSVRIVKLIGEVSSNKDDIIINMENGVLKVSLKKTNPITEYTL